MLAAFLRNLVHDFRGYEYVYYTAANELENVLILGFIYSLALIIKASQPFSLT